MDDLHTAPLPAVVRPSPGPGYFSTAFALAASAWQLLRANGNGRSAALTFAAVGCGFFLGRRLGGALVALLTAGLLAALTAGFAFGNKAQLAIFLAVMGAWWALRFRDDRAPANGLVTLAAFITLGWLVVRGGW